MKPTKLINFIFLLSIFFIYFISHLFKTIPGKMKYAILFALSILLFLAFFCICFDNLAWRIFLKLYKDKETFKKRIYITAIFILANLTHYGYFFGGYIKVPEMPLNAANISLSILFSLAALYIFLKVTVSYSIILWFSFAWGITLRIIGIVFLPLNPRGADMLVTITYACSAFLKGINPYALNYHIEGSYFTPIGYLPLMWLFYVPFKFMGLDIRWLNIISQIGVFIVFFMIARSSKRIFLNLFILSLFFLLPDNISGVIYRQVSFYWVILVLFLYSVHKNRRLLAGLFVSLLLLIRPQGFLFLAFYLIYLLKNRELRLLFFQGLFSILIFILGLLPFADVGFARLKYVLFDCIMEIGNKQPWDTTLEYLSMGGVFKFLGFGYILKYLQFLTLGIIGLYYLISKDRSVFAFYKIIIIAYFALLWFYPAVFIYYWMSVILVAIFLFLIEDSKYYFSSD